ncbi:hypothetical protein LINGRAHAP2_LOCUS15187 [Linum grandiflorum]
MYQRSGFTSSSHT